MNIVKENIQEEDNDDNKEKEKDKDCDNINNNNNNENNEKINNINDKNEENKEEELLISQINLKEKLSEQDINNSPKLILEEIEGYLFNGKK